MGSWSITHWIIVLIVIALVFGTKKLRNMGEDLGAAVKGFKDGIKQGQEDNKVDTDIKNTENTENADKQMTDKSSEPPKQ